MAKKLSFDKYYYYWIRPSGFCLISYGYLNILIFFLTDLYSGFNYLSFDEYFRHSIKQFYFWYMALIGFIRIIPGIFLIIFINNEYVKARHFVFCFLIFILMMVLDVTYLARRFNSDLDYKFYIIKYTKITNYAISSFNTSLLPTILLIVHILKRNHIFLSGFDHIFYDFRVGYREKWIISVWFTLIYLGILDIQLCVFHYIIGPLLTTSESYPKLMRHIYTDRPCELWAAVSNGPITILTAIIMIYTTRRVSSKLTITNFIFTTILQISLFIIYLLTLIEGMNIAKEKYDDLKNWPIAGALCYCLFQGTMLNFIIVTNGLYHTDIRENKEQDQRLLDTINIPTTSKMQFISEIML